MIMNNLLCTYFSVPAKPEHMYQGLRFDCGVYTMESASVIDGEASEKTMDSEKN
jgi:hypothetical protein